MGHDHITSSNIKIVLVDLERNLLGVKGAVPGPKGSLVVVKEARKQ
jgi:large subunit ribosomal protein L3